MHKGIDVSNFQGHPDFRAVHDADRRFVYVKRSEGATVLDAGALDRARAARSENLHTGFYHFLHPEAGRSGKVEAEFFYKHVKGYEGRPGGAELLRLVLDIEVTHFGGKDVAARTLEYAHEAAERLQQIAGHEPVVYTYPAFISDWGQRFAEYPLWIAHPGVAKPTIPRPWRSYAAWQNSFNGHVPGVSGPVDTDLCPDLSALILERASY